MKLTTHLHQVLRLRMIEVYFLFSYTPLWCRQGTFHLYQSLIQCWQATHIAQLQMPVCFYAYLYFWVEAVACHLQITQLSDSVETGSLL
jgi:hypothetical protein